MKNLIAFLLYLLSATALFSQVTADTRIQVLSKSKLETILSLDLSGIDQHPVQTPQGEALVIDFAEGTPLLQAGAPDIAKYTTALLIPETGNMSIEVLAGNYQEFADVQVAPSKGDLKRNVDPATAPYTYGSAYERDEFFPGRLAELKMPFVQRAARGQALWIYPVQYNPVSKVLRVYTHLTLRIHHVGGSGVNELKINPLTTNSPAFEQLYAKTFLNFDPAFLARNSAGEPEKMLIIAKDEFVPQLDALVTWKRQSGIHTTVVPVSEIGASDASTIHAFVKNFYQTEGVTYLLLVGDETAISPLMRSSGGTMYACDNCFGYMDENDHLSDLFVGRFNAANTAQLSIMLNRQLEYEKYPLVDTLDNWCATAMASCSNEGAGIGDDGQADFEQGNEWKTKHLADGFEKIWEFYDGNHAAISPTPGDETADKNGNPVNTELVQAMNERGVTLYNYTGHGWEQGLVSGNFNTDAVATLRNHHRYPIVIAVACCAGNFTNNQAGDCLGEAMQRAGDSATGEAWGGIAGFYSSDFQSWSPPMEGQDGMNQYLLDADGIALRPSIGGMAAYGNALMITAYGNGGEVMADFWNPFLDPSTLPRTQLPKTLSATHPAAVFLGATSLSVQSETEGALVGLYWQGQTLAAARVENGVAVLNFPALDNVGELTVTVTQFNHIPYQGNLNATVAVGPYVINKTIQLNDITGDNDQKADYGESVSVDLELANVGISAALATGATLSTTDDNVTITDADAWFGDLEDSTSLLIPGAFAFQVNDDVVDGHVVNFTLTLNYSDTLSYSFPVAVKLQAPELEVTTLIIDDTQGGDGDGRLESGETALVTVGNRNNGSSASPLAQGTLSSDAPWLAIGPAVELGALAADNNTAPATFPVTVAPDAPASALANFHYQVAAGNYLAEKSYGPYTVNAILETFETYNFNSFDWQMGGNKPWTITTVLPYEGAYCARSGIITHNQKSQLKLTLNVTEDGLVRFARRVSSESDYDFLRFYIDSTLVASWSGIQAWAEASFPVSAGIHTLLWSYEKDQFGTDGQDRAWVDEISLPPHQIVVDAGDIARSAGRLSAQPNPTSSAVQLRLEDAGEPLEIAVFDGLGRVVIRQYPTQGRVGNTWIETLDMSQLTPGVYVVQVRMEAGMEAVKVIRH